MKIIAHRGLINGPDATIENDPSHISKVLKLGYDCEIDVWYLDSCWMLGHDYPTFIVEYDFLEQAGLWIHAKNLNALYVLGADSKLNFFWHQTDNFTLTSQGYIWTYPGQQLTLNSVQVMPEWNDPKFENINWDCYGICTDYPLQLKELRQAHLPKSL